MANCLPSQCLKVNIKRKMVSFIVHGIAQIDAYIPQKLAKKLQKDKYDTLKKVDIYIQKKNIVGYAILKCADMQKVIYVGIV